MNDKKKFLIIIVVFVLVIAGALVLYNKLSKDVSRQQIIVHETPQATAEPAASDEVPKTTATEADLAVEESAEADPQLFPAPDVNVYDRDGNAVQLSSFFGKPMVLNFWASWCGPCQMEMPDFQAKYKELGDKVNFVMVNMTDGQRETVKTASGFIDLNGFEFPVFYDTTSEAAMAYEAYSLPTTYFINAEGYIVAQAVGAIDAETLQKGIDLVSA